MTDPTTFVEQLRHWARAIVDRAADVAAVSPMPGNSGLSFGFDVLDAGGAVVAGLVIRLAPPNVKRSGNTDVLRQVPLLTALDDAGIPIAELVWSTADPEWFGTDAIVQVRLAAKPLHMTDPTARATVVDGDVAGYVRRAVKALADVHALDWTARLADWSEPLRVADDLNFWARLLGRSVEPRWVSEGERLRRELSEADPETHVVGLFHGDFQTNNVLYDDDGAIAALIDWEIAGIGPVGLDLGWLSIMTDPSCWQQAHGARIQVVVAPDQLLEWYGESTGAPLARFEFYRALACFRFGCIVAFNHRLHVSGQRVDPAYDLLAPSVEVLFARGRELLAAR